MVPLSNFLALTWTNKKSPCKELAADEEDSLLKRKSDQCPARSDGVARSNSNKTKSDQSPRVKKEGKNLSSSLQDRSVLEKKDK